ncbi:MAG: hypothetical protein ABSD50_17310, partial [Smithella sp.]
IILCDSPSNSNKIGKNSITKLWHFWGQVKDWFDLSLHDPFIVSDYFNYKMSWICNCPKADFITF